MGLDTDEFCASLEFEPVTFSLYSLSSIWLGFLALDKLVSDANKDGFNRPLISNPSLIVSIFSLHNDLI
ncbi:unnamed protein product [Schistosoma curassoni]|uniref:Ovule protein n=1 Tax=Schistosoma curassoni TaxID=6186 RepID=A0A183JKM0_9TREM|nr:unnamed protein product [Schistosoma curassoni]